MKKLLVILTMASIVIFSDARSNNPETEQQRFDVVQQYSQYIGTREATGNNDGREVALFLQSTGLDEGYAWCAAFVNYCLEQSGIKTDKSAWSPSWFSKSKLIYQRNTIMIRKPLPGDVFGIYFLKKKRIAHVGFIHHWTDGAGVVTVEGNTNKAGSREGDGVYRKWRMKSQIHSIANYIN